MKSTQSLNDLVKKAANEIIAEFAHRQLKADELAITLVDLTDKDNWKSGNFRGDEAIYPASVVKLFYLAAVHRWLEERKLSDTDELRRAIKDMLVDSSNDATGYLVDLLTDTTSGPELSDYEMEIWSQKRNAINRYFAALGYNDINVNQKPWGDGPYGRERTFVGKQKENRNKLTTNATAQLLTNIVRGVEINAPHSKEMIDLLSRNFKEKSSDPDNQATGFTGTALPADAKLWSKAGWTSIARHDAAYIELANGIRFVLVVFTENHAQEHGIIPKLAKKVIMALQGGYKAPVKSSVSA